MTSGEWREGAGLRLGLGVTGFGVASLLFAYLETTNFAPLNPGARAVAVIACPFSLLSLLFLDAEPHTAAIAFIWLLIASFNASLYALIGEIARGGRKIQ